MALKKRFAILSFSLARRSATELEQAADESIRCSTPVVAREIVNVFNVLIQRKSTGRHPTIGVVARVTSMS
jgi:hypothetical protein